MSHKRKIKTRRLTAGLVFAWLVFAQNIASGITASDPQVKAVFLYNFALFTKWPASAFNHGTDAFRICVAGDHDVESTLRIVTENESVSGHPIVVSRLGESLSAIRICHILFIGSIDEEMTSLIIHKARSTTVLTIIDSDQNEATGGAVTLTKKNRRIHPVINLEVARESGLDFSAKLLNLATLVNTPPPENPK